MLVATAEDSSNSPANNAAKATPRQVEACIEDPYNDKEVVSRQLTSIANKRQTATSAVKLTRDAIAAKQHFESSVACFSAKQINLFGILQSLIRATAVTTSSLDQSKADK